MSNLSRFIATALIVVVILFSYLGIASGIDDTGNTGEIIANPNSQDMRFHYALSEQHNNIIELHWNNDDTSILHLQDIDDSKSNLNPRQFVSVSNFDGQKNIPPPMINDIALDFSKRGYGAEGFKFDIPGNVNDVIEAGTAFLINLTLHEIGHAAVADHVGADGSRLGFFRTDGGQFFLGTSSVEHIDEESRLPYTMGGEFFTDITFEHALQDYRKHPNSFNRSLLVLSGTDFLWYCFYSFYIANENPSFDPITISKETGLSRDMLFSITIAKTLLNAYRVYSGEDRIIPYFTVDRYSAALNIALPF